jgi:hypothetical protein
MCITVDTADYQVDRVVVVFALWTVPGVPLAVIKKDGRQRTRRPEGS